MTFAQETIYPPGPSPKRCQGCFLGYSPKYNRILYCVDNLVYQRGIVDIHDCEVYTEHVNKTTVAAYSPNGRWIASADETGKIRIWTPTNADKTLQIETQPISGPILDLSWTDDSERLAAIGLGSKGYGGAINASTGASIGEVSGHMQPVQSVALKPNRPYRMVTGGDDSASVFYKGPPFKVAQITNDHTKFVLCVRYAPSGEVFGTSSLDGDIKIYDGTEGKLKTSITVGSGMPGIVFAPDSKSLLAATLDGRVVQYPVEGGAALKTWNFGNDLSQQQHGVLWGSVKVSISLNGDLNILNDDGTFKTQYLHSAGLTCAAKIGEGSFATGDTNGRAILWEGGAAVAANDAAAPVSGIAAFGGNVAVARCDGQLTVFAKNGSEVAKATFGKKGSGHLVAGAGFVIGYSEKTLFKYSASGINSKALDFVPSAIGISGEQVAVGGQDKIVHIFDSALNEKEKYSGLLQACTAVAFSPDGTHVAASSEQKEIVVWKRGTAEPIHEGWRVHSLIVTKILWLSATGLLTVAKDRSIRLWSLEKKRKFVDHGRAHEGQILDAFLDAPGKLVTAGTDGAAKVWKITPIE